MLWGWRIEDTSAGAASRRGCDDEATIRSFLRFVRPREGGPKNKTRTTTTAMAAAARQERVDEINGGLTLTALLSRFI